MLASAHFPARCLPHHFPEHFLLVSSSAGVVEEVFLCLDHSASTATPPAFVAILVPEPFQVHCGETAELEGREPIVNTPPYLSRHPMGIRPKGICEKRAVLARGA